MGAPTGELVAELVVADAAELARRGGYDAALRLLDESEVDTPAGWDLRARIHAQRGETAQADAAWERVLAARPDDPAALAGRALLARIERGPRWRRRPLPLVACGAVALVVLAGGAVTAGLLTPHPAARHPAVSAAPGSSGDAALRRRLADAEAQQQRQRAEADAAARRLAALAGALRGPGVTVRQRDRDVAVAFGTGLFPPDGGDLTDQGRAALAGWGRRLAGQRVTVTVLGHQARVGTGGTSGTVLEIWRATAAADALSAASGLPLSAFTVAAADASAAPYAGTDPTTQSLDRTVTVLVTPA